MCVHINIELQKCHESIMAAFPVAGSLRTTVWWHAFGPVEMDNGEKRNGGQGVEIGVEVWELVGGLHKNSKTTQKPETASDKALDRGSGKHPTQAGSTQRGQGTRICEI